MLPLSAPRSRDLFRGRRAMDVRTPLKVSVRSFVLEKDAWKKYKIYFRSVPERESEKCFI